MLHRDGRGSTAACLEALYSVYSTDGRRPVYSGLFAERLCTQQMDGGLPGGLATGPVPRRDEPARGLVAQPD